MDTLYLIEIGGIRDDCLFELHSVHALIARDDADLVAQCRDRFSAMYGAPHIDGWIALDLAADGGDDANPAKAFSLSNWAATVRPKSARSMTMPLSARRTGAKP
jgi:hypothetical protein